MLTLVGGGLVPGEFNAPSAAAPFRYAYYVKTEDGYWSHIASNDASSITLPMGFGGEFEGGELVEIRAHTTIADYFGPNNEAGLTDSAAGNSLQADTISILDVENGNTTITIFASDVLGGAWITPGFQSADDYPIYPGQAIQVGRIGQGALKLLAYGDVDVMGLQSFVRSGVNLKSMPTPMETTLGELVSLYTGDPTTGVAGTAHANSGEADRITVLRDGSSQVFFYSEIDLGHGIGWYDVSFQYAGNYVIPMGAGILITRDNPTVSDPFIWRIPAPIIEP